MMRQALRTILLLLPIWGLEQSHAADSSQPLTLNDRNTEVPFPYVRGGQRSWPIIAGPLVEAQLPTLTARRDGKVLATGRRLDVEGLSVSVSNNGKLVIKSKSKTDDAEFELEVSLKQADGETQSQKLSVRPAPPARPITYLADFGDDLIRIFHTSNNRYRPITKDGFDQYFRRLQAQGISRLIVWQSPFPYIADPENYTEEDWQRYAGQARAIVEDADLTKGIKGRSGFSAWGWLRMLMSSRLMPELGQMMSDSAAEHGISLTASFRPFEAALTKYYVVPAFDEAGEHLWDFQPLCSPTVNYHPEKIGFAHYRELLRRMNKPERATLETLEFPGVANAAELVKHFEKGESGLEIRASRFPPLAGESFVLVRINSGEFKLRRYRDIRESAREKLPLLKGYRLEAADSGLRVRNVQVPAGYHYLLITQPPDAPAKIELSTEAPVVLTAQAGNRLGGENVYFALDENGSEPEPTRVSGIPPDGHYHAEFQATEASIAHFLKGPQRVPLAGKQLVIDLGPDWSVEMMDFTQPAARRFAVKQLKTVLSYPAFDEIIINTRSHTQLAAYMADDGEAVRPIAALRREGKRGYYSLGLDRAYAPRNAAAAPLLRTLANDPDTVERITTPQQGEWRAVSCQQPAPHPWRYTRNRLVAEGVGMLLRDLEREFPETRIRAVIPPQAAAIERIHQNLETMKNRQGGVYGRDYYRRLWCSNNHIPSIGEGMALVDLTGTRIEPVFLGSGGYANDAAPFEMFVTECIADMKKNRGSSYKGPRSYFYEGQFTLRTADKNEGRRTREQMICHLLSRRGEINEVILYEAADWTYYLPLSDPDLCGHYFVERCGGAEAE